MSEDNESIRSARSETHRSQAGVRHGRHLDMGIASSDPDYLATGDGTANHPFRGNTPSGARRPMPEGRPDFAHLLESPAPGKPIFIAQRKRKARRGRIAAIAVIAIATFILIWYAVTR